MQQGIKTISDALLGRHEVSDLMQISKLVEHEAKLGFEVELFCRI